MNPSTQVAKPTCSTSWLSRRRQDGLDFRIQMMNISLRKLLLKMLWAALVLRDRLLTKRGECHAVTAQMFSKLCCEGAFAKVAGKITRAGRGRGCEGACTIMGDLF